MQAWEARPSAGPQCLVTVSNSSLGAACAGPVYETNAVDGDFDAMFAPAFKWVLTSDSYMFKA
jgi:hypothetical protein